MDCSTSARTLLNWAASAIPTPNKLIPALKKKFTYQDGANVNVDERWLRYHAYNKRRPVWCLVTEKRVVNS